MPSPVTLVEVSSGVPTRDGTSSAGRRGSNPWATALVVLAAACVTALCLVLAPGASAGEYHVYSCRTPAGEVAPVDGWGGSVAGSDDSATDTCASGGALTAALRGGMTHEANVDFATWELSVPAFDTMLGATLWRAADADGGEGVNATYETWLAGPTQSSPFGSCVYQFGCTTGVGDQAQPLAEANRVVVPAANLGAHLYVNAACEGSFTGLECPAGAGDANGYAAAVYLYAADILLEQSPAPTASNVSGELATAATVAGTSDVIFSASDPGAGVWEATFSVDGKVVQSTVPDENGGRCRDVGQTSDGLPAFLHLQPCPASESVDVPFDTSGLSNGEHHLIVSVLDAAGNSAPVLDREIEVEEPGSCAGGGWRGQDGRDAYGDAAGAGSAHVEGHAAQGAREPACPFLRAAVRRVDTEGRGSCSSWRGGAHGARRG